MNSFTNFNLIQFDFLFINLSLFSDGGALYFDDKLIDGHEHQGPLSIISSVVRGLTAFVAVITGSLNVRMESSLIMHFQPTYLFSRMCFNTSSLFLQLPGDKILGLAKFFLNIGVPGDAKDFFNQIDSLACLESNRQDFSFGSFNVFAFI